MSRLITFFHIFLDNADSEDKKPFESGDGTAATTIADNLDELEKDNEIDMVVEIKASDKILTDEKYYEEMKPEHREALEANLPSIESFYNKLQCTVCSKNVDPVIGKLNDFISSTNIENSNFGCLFTFCYLDGTNSIKTDLHICNLWTGQFVSYKGVI